jgi:hypothetical protein
MSTTHSPSSPSTDDIRYEHRLASQRFTTMAHSLPQEIRSIITTIETLEKNIHTLSHEEYELLISLSHHVANEIQVKSIEDEIRSMIVKKCTTPQSA